MNFFKITFEDGNWIQTGFNGSFEDARNYYVGRKFELDESKPMVKVVAVEQIG